MRLVYIYSSINFWDRPWEVEHSDDAEERVRVLQSKHPEHQFEIRED